MSSGSRKDGTFFAAIGFPFARPAEIPLAARAIASSNSPRRRHTTHPPKRACLELLHVIITRELDVLRVKGKTEGVLVHEIIARKNNGLSEKKQGVIDIYNQGLASYKKRRWDEGIELFNKALSIDSSDTPSSVYIERCKEFKLKPPPDDWDGIFTMRTK